MTYMGRGSSAGDREREPVEQPSPNTASAKIPHQVGLNKPRSSHETGESVRVASIDGSASHSAVPPRTSSSRTPSRASAFSEEEATPPAEASLHPDRIPRTASTDRTSDRNKTSNVYPGRCIPTLTPGEDDVGSPVDRSVGWGGGSNKPRVRRMPSVSSAPPTVVASSPGRIAAAIPSSAGSSDCRSTGKRRMLLDTDVRRADEGELYDGGGHLDYRGEAHEMEPPIDDNGRRQQQQQLQPQRQEQAAQTVSIRRDSDDREIYRHAEKPKSSRRGADGDASSSWLERNERPSTPAPAPAKKHPRTARSTADDDNSPALGHPVGRASLCAPGPAPLDTVMEDRDCFDELSAADDEAFTRAAASIQQVAHRQLAVREGFARCHARLLQDDAGLNMMIKMEKFMEGARSLLDDMGIIDEKETAGDEQMEEEKEEEEDGEQAEEGWAYRRDSHEQPVPPPMSKTEKGAPDTAGVGADDVMDVAETHE